MNKPDSEVWNTVKDLNRCWTGGNPGDLRHYFHETMIAITPSDSIPLVGQEACIAAWAKYAETTKILSWETSDCRVQVYNETAVVTYLYKMECERGGERFSPTGRDMMILIKDNDRWRVVADQFSPYPGGDVL